MGLMGGWDYFEKEGSRRTPPRPYTLNPEVKAKPFAAGGERFRRCSGESVLGSTANGTHGLRGDGAQERFRTT